MASLPANFSKVNVKPKGEKPRPLIKPDYSTIKHPSTIKLISVVKIAENPPPGDQEFIGLTKGELIQFINDPFWSKLRTGLMSICGVGFFVMLFGALIILILAPSCEQQGHFPGHDNATSALNHTAFFSNSDVSH